MNKSQQKRGLANLTITGVLKELREKSRDFIKLDLAYIVALGTAITVLRLNRIELFEFTAGIKDLVFVFLFILFFDVTVYSVLWNEWLDSITGIQKRILRKYILGIIYLQPIFHFLLICLLVLGGVGYSLGYSNARAIIHAQASIQNNIETFIAKQDRSPTSLDEIIESFPRVTAFFEKIKKETILYEKKGKKDYRLVFPGLDGKLGTDDDFEVPHELQLQKAIDNL